MQSVAPVEGRRQPARCSSLATSTRTLRAGSPGCSRRIRCSIASRSPGATRSAFRWCSTSLTRRAVCSGAEPQICRRPYWLSSRPACPALASAAAFSRGVTRIRIVSERLMAAGFGLRPRLGCAYVSGISVAHGTQGRGCGTNGEVADACGRAVGKLSRGPIAPPRGCGVPREFMRFQAGSRRCHLAAASQYLALLLSLRRAMRPGMRPDRSALGLAGTARWAALG